MTPDPQYLTYAAILLTFGAIAALIIRRNVNLARRYVKAGAFLDQLNAGNDATSANAAAALPFSKHSTKDSNTLAMQTASQLAINLTKGEQIPLIQLAVTKGFFK